jgi:hypothetical protein
MTSSRSTSPIKSRSRSSSGGKRGDPGASKLPNEQQQTSLTLPTGQVMMIKTKRSAVRAGPVQASPVQGGSALAGVDVKTKEGYEEFKAKLDTMTRDAVLAAQTEIKNKEGLSKPERGKLLLAVQKRLEQPEKAREPSAEETAAKQRVDAEAQEAAVRLRRQAMAQQAAMERVPTPAERRADAERRLLEALQRSASDEAALLKLNQMGNADTRELNQAKTNVEKSQAAVLKWRLEQRWNEDDVPTWAELPKYAETVPLRGPGEKPHPVIVHLLQRLSDAQNGKRPPIQVRHRHADGTITYEPVTEANYWEVLHKASLYTPADLSDAERTALGGLTNLWRPLPVDNGDLTNMVDRWLQEGNVKVEGAAGGPDVDTVSKEIRKQVEAACKKILTWVEPALRDLVGLPKLVIHTGQGASLTRGFYDPEKQEIHLTLENVKAPLILHEFGHHIEDQGPVEVWCTFASYLRKLGAPSKMVAQSDVGAVVSEEPYIGWYWGDAEPKLPRGGYALVSYGSGLTELLPIAMEQEGGLQPFDNPDGVVDWTDDIASTYYPEYMARLLPAVRPKEAELAGVKLPTLMGYGAAG